jgi:hypothetical protein
MGLGVTTMEIGVVVVGTASGTAPACLQDVLRAVALSRRRQARKRQ